MRGICLVMLLLVCANAKAAGDRSGIEPVGKSTASFLPPITPPLSGSPGNNKYLQSNGIGVVSWAAKPSASQIAYTPSTPLYWPIVPTEVAGALDSLASLLTSVSATASARSAIVNFAIGNATSINTNNYLGALGDQSATSTSVAPVVIPCTGTLSGIRAQRTTNSASTSVQQFFKSTGGAVVSYIGTGVSCSISVGNKECNATTAVPVTIGDMLIVRVTGAAWSIGAGAISTKILCQ